MNPSLLSVEEASLYLSVTAFALTVAIAALKFREAATADRMRAILALRGYDEDRIEQILERPVRWAFYSVVLFVLSGFAFLADYLTPQGLLGAEAQPAFIGALFLYVLAFVYFMILFASTIFTDVRGVFEAAYWLGRYLKIGTALGVIQWTIGFELIPAFIFAASLFTGAEPKSTFGWIFLGSTLLSLIGNVVIVWAALNYIGGKGRKFGNRTLAIGALFFILPFFAYAVFYLL